MAYLDHASATPLHPAARAALLAAYDDGWADPARLYGEGRRARLLLDNARARVATCLGSRPDEVSFCGSGTQSVELALQGALAGRARTGRHVVTSAVEHSAVLTVAEANGDTSVVDVDRLGRVDAAEFAAALRPDTAVASLQHGNHEVGTLQPVAAVAAECADRGVPLHVDAAQTVGRLAVDVGALGAALLSASAHKWGGPPGVGILVVRKGMRWRPPGLADEREGGRVSGFPNLPAVLAAAAALDARQGELEAENARLTAWVAMLREEIPGLVADVEVVGPDDDRLPHLLTFSCLYVDGEALVTELDRRGIAVTSGSSCTSSTRRPSHVLEAMGVLTHGNVRVSLGRSTVQADVDALLAALPEVVRQLRSVAGTEGR